MRLLLVFLLSIALSTEWVIYRRSQKKKLVCREEPIESTNGTSNSIIQTSATTKPNSESGEKDDSDSSESRERRGRRQRRDIRIDPIHKEPIIFLGGKGNTSTFIDDGDFDIVADTLTAEELAEVKRHIMDTCNALNSE